jgi:hypothetical protein
MDSITIAIDFDGTCVVHDYPRVGKDIGAVPILKKLVNNGHRLILYTMRSGQQLDDAIEWFKTNDIQLYGIQFNPTQNEWTTSNKCYANLYIDDAALGIPLRRMNIKNDDGDKMSLGRSFVDWRAVDGLLTNMGLFNSGK